MQMLYRASNVPALSSKLIFALTLLVSATLAVADPLEDLKQRQTKLESDLRLLKDQIRELEQKAPAVESSPPQHFYVKKINREIDSAGGVKVWAWFQNPHANRTIKYIDLTVTPYNSVGDAVSSSIGGKRRAELRYTGPLDADADGYITWLPIWYNSTIECLKIESVRIFFAKEPSIIFRGKTLESALAPDLDNDCKFLRK